MTQTTGIKLTRFWHGRSAWITTAAAQFSILGFGVISGIVSGRLLGPQGRGELAAVTLWPMAFAFLASFGFNQAIVFYTGRKRHTVSEVWTAALLIGLAESLVVVAAGIVLLPILLRHYSHSVVYLGFVFLSATPALILAGIPVNIFQGKGDLSRFNWLRSIAPAIYAASLLLFLLLRLRSLQAVVWTQAAGYVAALIVGLAVLHRRISPSIEYRKSTVFDFLKYGTKTHLANLTSYLNQRADQLILSLLIPAQQLGFYAVAVTLSMSVLFFPMAAGMVTFSRGANQSDEALRRTIGKSFRMSFLWLLVACSALFAIAPYLITAVLGPSFAGSIIACRLLLPGIVAVGLNQVLYNGANAMGKPTLPSYAEAVGLLVTTIGLLSLVGRYGYIGAAIVSSFAYITSLIVMLAFAAISMHLRLRDLLLAPAAAQSLEQAEVVSA